MDLQIYKHVNVISKKFLILDTMNNI
jgi:hypothetical protein